MPERTPTNATKGDWIRVHRIEMEPDERSDDLPESTREVPLESWMKGRLLDESAAVGETAAIETPIGREVTGELVEVIPAIRHGFGTIVPELADAGTELEELMAEIDR